MFKMQSAPNTHAPTHTHVTMTSKRFYLLKWLKKTLNIHSKLLEVKKPICIDTFIPRRKTIWKSWDYRKCALKTFNLKDKLLKRITFSFFFLLPLSQVFAFNKLFIVKRRKFLEKMLFFPKHDSHPLLFASFVQSFSSYHTHSLVLFK